MIAEIMGNNLRTKETIALGEGEHRSFYEIIEASSPFGWMTFDQSILNAYENDLITEETARLFASRKEISRGIDLIQKARGVEANSNRLRLDVRRTLSLGIIMDSEHTAVFDLAITPARLRRSAAYQNSSCRS